MKPGQPPTQTPILVILGPTASGKSALAVELAREFNGEIISADSRQIYTGLDIGTGKITATEMQGIPHHLIDVADPTISASDPHHYTVTMWKADAEKAIADIARRGKLPIICGGTGFYIESLIDNIEYPDAPADQALRDELEKKPLAELADMLRSLDSDRAASIDLENRRRVIRSIEIARTLGSVPTITPRPRPDWKVLKIGVSTPDDLLKEKIKARLISRIDSGMIEEAQRLHATPAHGGIGLSYERMHELGLEYRYLAEYLKSVEQEQDAQKVSTESKARELLISTLATKIWQYARRQKAWFKRDKSIEWMEIDSKEKVKAVIEKVRQFLS